MEESEMIISRMAPFVFGFIQFIIIIACVILVSKKSSIGSLIMLVSSILSGLMDIVRPIVYSFDIDNFMLVNNIFTVLSAMFYGLFSIGIIIFALSFRKS